MWCIYSKTGSIPSHPLSLDNTCGSVFDDEDATKYDVTASDLIVTRQFPPINSSSEAEIEDVFTQRDFVVSGYLKETMSPVTLRADRSASVVNLSSETFSDAEMSLLSKGLSFRPTAAFLNIQEIKCDLRKFDRNMRLAEYFSTIDHTVPFHIDSATGVSSTEQSTGPLHEKRDHSIFRSKSSFTPKCDRNETLNTYISTVTNEIIERCNQVTHQDFRINLFKEICQAYNEHTLFNEEHKAVHR